MLSEKETDSLFEKYAITSHACEYHDFLSKHAFRKAARAIVEKMQEGVALERPCNVAHLNRVLGFDVIGTELTDASGDTVYAVILGEWLGEDGQQGCMTVTLE